MRLAFQTLVISLLLLSSAATAGTLQRCVDANGVSVYTDRGCGELDAVARPSDFSAPRGFGGMAPRGCARTPDALLEGLRGALESGDVNRLASFYHWPGTSRGGAKRLMDALEAVAKRPLVSLDLAYADGSGPGDPQQSPAPIAIALEQMTGYEDAGSHSTRFGLQRHAGCWWIRF